MANIFQEYGKSYNNIDEFMVSLNTDINELEQTYQQTFEDISTSIANDTYDANSATIKKMDSITIREQIEDVQSKLIAINAKIRQDIGATDLDGQLTKYTTEKNNTGTDDIEGTYSIDIQSLITEYNSLKRELYTLYEKYNTNMNAMNTDNLRREYYLMYVWIIILCVLLGAAFVSIVDEDKSMNMFARFILFIVLAVILYNIYNNIRHFANGHSLMM